MHTLWAPVDRSPKCHLVSGRTAKTPVHTFMINRSLQIPEDVLLPIVPKYRFVKDQPERHLIG